MAQVERDLDAVDAQVGVEGERVAERPAVRHGKEGGERGGDGGLGEVGGGALQPPGLGQAHGAVRVGEAEAEIGAGAQPAAVPVRRAVGAPGRVGHVGLARGVGQDFLYVAPAQRRVGVEHERDHAGHRGRGEGGAGEGGGVAGRIAARAGGVGGEDAHARGADQQRRARVGEARHATGAVGCGDRDGVHAVLVVVVIHVVAQAAGVAGGEDVVGAEAAAARRGAVDQRRLGGQEAPGVEVVLEQRRVAPGGVDHVEARAVAQRAGVLRGVAGRAEADAQPGDVRVIGHADHARSVGGGADDAHDRGAVPVARLAPRVGVAHPPIVVERRLVVGGEVGERVVEAVVHHRDLHAAAGVVGPGGTHVQARGRVRQVPLVGEQRVGDRSGDHGRRRGLAQRGELGLQGGQGGLRLEQQVGRGGVGAGQRRQRRGVGGVAAANHGLRSIFVAGLARAASHSGVTGGVPTRFLARLPDRSSSSKPSRRS